MRILERITLLVFAAALLLFAGSKAYSHFFVDSTPPTITCDSDTVELHLGQSREALLQGVSAHDNKDGDITAQIMVQGVTQLIGSNTAKVTYVVFDKANNMASCTRTVRYLDYQKPFFSMDRPAIYPLNATVTLLDRLYAHDVVDGDISGNIRIVSQNVNSKEPGTYSVTAQVSNSLGDTDTVNLKVIITDRADEGEPELPVLSQYIVYLHQGAAFDPAQYIAEPERWAVSVEHQVDTSVPGTYHVSYTYGGDTVWMTVVVR